MKNANTTVVLNKKRSDGFLDLNSPTELSKVMDILDKLMETNEDE